VLRGGWSESSSTQSITARHLSISTHSLPMPDRTEACTPLRATNVSRTQPESQLDHVHISSNLPDLQNLMIFSRSSTDPLPRSRSACMMTNLMSFLTASVSLLSSSSDSLCPDSIYSSPLSLVCHFRKQSLGVNP
jgi:hypothetical protein